MELEKTVYPLSRYWYSGDFRFYYAYGNTPAQDFLQNITAQKEPAILVLGCGDIRSCFYSLWKNFDVKGPARFDGVHFVLNDNSAAVLARNILFLYLCYRMPEEDSALRKWLSGMWAIWYCHELHQEHYDMLNESLHTLCSYSDAWSSKDNPLYPLVNFTSPATLEEVKSMWKMWLDHDIGVTSVKEMHTARQIEHQVRGWAHNHDAHASGFTEGITEIPFEREPKCDSESGKAQVQKTEVLDYLRNGSVYAEAVLGLDLPSSKTFINFTFYERPDGRYNLHYRSLPFSCYYQVVDFTKKQLQSMKFKNPGFQLLVKDKCFIKHPFLANSVQQFALWFQSSHKILCSKQKFNLSFSFDCSHALTFCYELEHDHSPQKFDLIYTSNLMDHLGPPNMILSAIPLLKDNGLLFTTTLYKEGVDSFEEYLSLSFGFDLKLLPLILGVRCINHEGKRYASPVTVKPCPVTIYGNGFVCKENLLIWEKLPPKTIPLKFSDDILTGVVAKALLDFVQISVYSLLKTPKLPQMITNLCVETAIKVFHVFMSNICSEFNYKFWRPLTDLMQKTIKPYLNNMQTQLFLHNTHMHLTVTESSCPICLQTPLSESIGLFSTTFFLQAHFQTPKFMAIVHKEGIDHAETLCDIARNNGRNVHIFDPVSPSSGSNNFLRLYFYAPLKFVHEGYKVTIVSSTMTSIFTFSSNIMYFPTQPLGSLRTPFTRFKLFKAVQTNVNEVQLDSFGTIISHVSDGDTTEIDISLQPHILSSMADSKVKPLRIASNILQLSCGEHRCQLKYPCPIAYDCVKITLKRKQNQMHIQCPRAFQQFEDEKPLFIVSPDKELSLLSHIPSRGAIESLCGQQLTNSERKMRTAATDKMSALLSVKEVLASFLQRDEQFYHFVHPDYGVMILLLINRVLFDYENKIPVVDLAFCILEESFVDFVVPPWLKLTGKVKIASINTDNTEYDLLKNVFRYFAGRTNGACNQLSSSNSCLNLIIKEGIQQYFTRAVVSLLLCDPDEYMSFIKELMLSKREPQQESQVTRSVTIQSENCDNCGMPVMNIKMCSNCKSAKYCTKKCQREHWAIHKTDCKKFTKKFQDKDDPDPNPESSKTTHPLFPLTRYWYPGDFKFYYAYGNTPAEDFLQNCPGVKEPTILLLGCGDIRSCFHTLWKHFDSSISSAPKQFDGVHFVLNDWSSSVLARNIVFLYLCFNLPKIEEEKNMWFCAMWALWYCHELYAEHQKVLDDCLRVLLKYSLSLEDWGSSDNPMQRFVKFTSSAVLEDISKIWKHWLERKFAVASVQEMYTSRYKELLQRGVMTQLKLYGFSFALSKTFISGDTGDRAETKVKARIPEVLAYVKSGNCYAENVIKNVKFLSSATTVNFTLYERPDGVYTLHYGSMPYSGYNHTVEFSPEALVSAGVSQRTCDTMLVESKSFQSLPFLASSVQQFTMWIQSASKVLNNERISVSFTFNNLHAVSFCQELQQTNWSGCDNQFDLIHASNHLGPSGVILSSLPLLKPNSLLIATTLISKGFANTIEDYLSTCIGFDCKLLPVLLGVRCINHEGTGYCSPVMIEPNPVEVGDMFEVKLHERTLLWEKVPAQPFVMSQLPPLASGNITDALFDCIKTSALGILTSHGTGQDIMNNNSLETAIVILQILLSSVSKSSSINTFLFWEPLVSALRLKLKPFLHVLQTQALLHDLHIHFTLKKGDCPKCSHTAIEKHMGLFCAEVPLPIRYMTPHFIALLHRYPSSDAQYLCNEAMSGKDVHIFDCIDGKVEGKILKLNFFAPIKFIAENYKVTLGLTCMTEDKNRIITVLPTSSVKSMQVDFMQYNFPKISQLPPLGSETSSFGQLVSHVCDGDQAHSEISLSESAMQALSIHKLSSKQISPMEIQLSCGSLQHSLVFKYPIDYNQVNIKLSKAKRRVEIVSKRQSHKFEEEKPVFVVTPDHQLSLPPQPVNDAIMICHSGIQMNKEERKIVDASYEGNHELMTPLLYVKKALMFFFQGKKRCFHLCSPHGMAIRGLVVVNQCLFDYQHKTPAMDLAFCFLDPSNSDFITETWMSIIRNEDSMNIVLDNEGYELLQKTLLYFTNRTNGDCQTSGKHSQYQVLHQNNIDHHFKRAVVYLLFRDPDHQGLDINSDAEKKPDFLTPYLPKPESGNPAIDEKCGYCGKYSPTTKKCTKCKNVQYCSKECQTKHWPVHNKSCKAAKTSNTQRPQPASRAGDDSFSASKAHKFASTQCTYCKKSSDSLKKCLRCKEVQYCGKECQTSHWPEHKAVCSSKS